MYLVPLVSGLTQGRVLCDREPDHFPVERSEWRLKGTEMIHRRGDIGVVCLYRLVYIEMDSLVCTVSIPAFCMAGVLARRPLSRFRFVESSSFEQAFL